MVPGQRMNRVTEALKKLSALRAREGFGNGLTGCGDINLDLFLNFSDRPAR